MAESVTRNITEQDGWLIDERNNRSEIAYFGSREAAEKALLSLVDCDNCINCSYCSDCSDCSGCSYCSDCSRCSDCSGCSYCSGCSGCSYCSDCSRLVGEQKAAVIEIPAIPNIHQTVYAAVTQPGAFDMDRWGGYCDTTRCRGGWVCSLAGDAGKALEARFNTELAAMLIYRESGFQINPCRFYDSDSDALADMKRLAEAEAAASAVEPA